MKIFPLLAALFLCNLPAHVPNSERHRHRHLQRFCGGLDRTQKRRMNTFLCDLFHTIMYRSITYSLLLCLAVNCMAQTGERDSVHVRLLQPEFYYAGDIAHNFSGGIKKGTAYLGLVQLMLTVNPWKNGSFYLNLANTHGNEPSANYLGDSQFASNIEAGNHTYVQELWYRQNLRKAEITVGLQDVNVEFAFTPFGGLYNNSSFGVIPTISCNVPAPIFPLTSVGISSKWRLSGKTTLLAALYDGMPKDFRNNPHNLNWDISKKDGVLLFAEVQRTIKAGHLSGILKGGLYFHEHFTAAYDSIYPDNNGFYFMGDQELWHQHGGNRSLGFFVHLGYCPKEFSTNSYYTGFGLNCTGIFSRQGKDMAGLGIAHAKLYNRANETAIELTYELQPLPFLFIQPDIQYIINPSGINQKLNNCFAAFLRFEVHLN
jgi:porin